MTKRPICILQSLSIAGLLINSTALVSGARTWIALGLAFAGATLCQPAISAGGVTNAASGTSGTLAQGSYFVIYGRNFGSAAGPVTTLPLPVTLGTTSVNIRAANSQTYQAFMYYVTPTQLAGIIPSNVPVGQASFTVVVGGASSAPANILIARTAFEAFTVNSIQNGQAIIQNYEQGPPVGLPVNQYLHPARPGQTLILWGTGLGPYTAGPDNQAPTAGNIASDVEIVIGPTVLRPFYAGRAPGIPGVDQINFTLPNDLSVPDGCTIPLTARTGGSTGRTSTVTTFAKATAGSVCVHPMRLSPDMLRRLDAGESIKAAYAQLDRFRVSGSFEENAAIQFVPQLNAGNSPVTDVRTRQTLSLPPGTCQAAPVEIAARIAREVPVLRSVPSSFEAGTISVSGGGKSMDLESRVPSDYQVQLATGLETPFPVPGIPPPEHFLVDGTFQFQGTGGRNVGAFSATASVSSQIEIPPPQGLLNLGRRGQSYRLTWTGGGNDPNDTVIIAMTETAAGVAFLCAARAIDRGFDVPSDITTRFASNSQVIFLLTATPASQRFEFTAPVTGSGNLDSGVGAVSTMATTGVFFQ
jgi:uncharacterized protein (TIGR03437 family)